MKKNILSTIILYLNSISGLATMENAFQTQQLTRKIIESIRYKTSREGQMLGVWEEKKAIEILVEFFKMRFGDSLEVKIAFDSEALEYYIPHYSLMTFVENALYYAFENKEDTCMLEISAKKDGPVLCFKIKDNGCGFDADIYMKSTEDSPQYGCIPSTVNRLFLHYGCADVVSIISSKRKGTVVLVKIPL